MEPRVQPIDRQPLRKPDGAPAHYERYRPEQTTLLRHWSTRPRANAQTE